MKTDLNNTDDARRLTLATQGQNWQMLQPAGAFQRPRALFDVPMEITIARLRVIRMVDETIIVNGDVPCIKEQ